MTKNTKLSPRQRIALHCKSCGADPAAPGSWRQQIGLCPVTSCELWPIRPLPTRQRPVTAELLAEYHVAPDEPAVADLRAKGLVQETAPSLATGLCGAPGHAIAGGQDHDKGSA